MPNPLIRNSFLVLLGVAIGLAGLATGKRTSFAQEATTTPTGLTATVEASQDDIRHEVGSTDGIVFVSVVIVLIVVIPILLRRRAWSNGSRRKKRAD
jgi:hypothetical protein